MLVLSRKPGESLVFNVSGPALFECTLIRAEDGTVRLGIEAPKNVHVLRKELLERTVKKIQAA